ncbi:hypothetical protein BGZ81_002295 [Podila clonocystis]|nr:hypothetical protein BGZ81_002295 [Podila clonocystis]
MTSSIPAGDFNGLDTTTTSQPSSRPTSRPTSIPPPHSQHSIVSPPNEPRQSLSTQLAPDYSSWVHDVATPTTSTSTSANNKSNKQNKGRARRENQPSFTGSALTVSDLDEDPDQDHDEHHIEDNKSGPEPHVGNDEDSGIGRRLRNPQQQEDSTSGTSYRGSSLSGQRSHPASSSSSSTGSKPAPRLRPLNKSRVESTDPTRPAYKLGPPLSTPSPPQPPPQPTSPPNFGSSPSLRKITPPENFNETSALLGGNRPRNPQAGGERWTNEGSGRRAPRYDGQDYLDEDQAMGDHADHDLDEGSDLLRRPSRARSLSPTMESRRGNNRRGRVLFRNNYPNGGHGSRSSGNPKKAFQNLRRSSIANINLVKEKLLTRRSGHYDDAKEALVKENNGIRIWYHNYTTIDWIHDFVKERVRLRHLRSMGGIRGMIRNRADSLKGWVLVLLTGVITACLAAFIDVASWWLGDLRMGYCTTNFWWSQYFCCWGSTGGQSCTEWVSWSMALSSDDVILGLSRDTFDWTIYICFGTLFAGICVVMVTSDGTVSQQRSHGATKRRSAPNGAGMPVSSTRTSFEDAMGANQPKKIAYFGAGSGIPEVKTILGGFVIRGFLGFRTLMIKLIGLPLMVASGLNMGKQGPLVHIACCVGNIVCRIFDKYNRNDGKRREILSAASAAGVAVAFGAPIGGVLFSLEEVSYYFPSKTMWRTYFCALISAVVLKMINPYRVGKTVLFQVTYDRDWHLFESIPFFFISVFGGVYGAIFSQFHMSYSRFRSRTWIGRHPVQEVLIVTVITCAIQWLNPWTRVNLLQLLTNLYSECTTDNDLSGMCAVEIHQIYPIFLLLAQVFVMKVALNFITFGVKVPGGIFIPTMVAGAVFGRMVGLGVQWLIATYPEHQVFQVCEGDSMDCIIPGLYAMIGAAACLAGVTRMTVSLVVIMFELTGAMTYSLPIMMAIMIGKFVGDAFSPDAFFNKLISLNEHPYLDSKKDYNTFGTAADIADRYLETIDVNELNDVESLRRKVEILTISGYSDGGLPIVDRGVLVGYIASNELRHALDLAEQKHPDCVCIFRNRATSNVPVTEIITSLNGLEAGTGTGGSDLAANTGYNYTTSPTTMEDASNPSRQRSGHHVHGEQELLHENHSRGGIDYDNDMQGHDQPIRHAVPTSQSKDSLNKILWSDSKSYKSQDTSIAQTGDDDFSELGYPHGSRRFANSSGRISTGTTDLLRDPAHTMDFTPFTDQAPLTVSLFSSMDLVMELFIKLGIKYVCVVKAGEHYGMIHKKRLLMWLKENDEKQKKYARRSCL